MGLDEYLKGVVPAEIGTGKPLEALKAQAIAARSYATTSHNHGQNADVCTTTHCQVWRPQHYPDIDQAVEATRGVFATYQGQIIRAFFFGHCDGHTRNSEDVWGGVLPYCRSVPCMCGETTLWGHGVGMCQAGAIKMAQQGKTARQIIQHYYTGVDISGQQNVGCRGPVAGLFARLGLRQSG